MNSLAFQSRIESLNYAFCISAANRRGVCVGGVQQELNSRMAIPEQIPRVVVRNDHSSVGFALADCVSKLVDRGIIAREAETLALGERRDQLPALGRPAIIDDSETHVRYRRAQGKPHQSQLHDGQDGETEHEFAVMASLGEFFPDQCAHTIIEQIVPELCHDLGLHLHPSHAEPCQAVEDASNQSDDQDVGPHGRPSPALQERVADDLDVIPAPNEA